MENETVVWDGEGLPPVGCECELAYKRSHPQIWLGCRIDFIGKGAVVVTTENNSEMCLYKDEVDFRPIKSEREIAVNEMVLDIAFSQLSDDFPGSVNNICTQLYNAGYRKVNQ